MDKKTAAVVWKGKKEEGMSYRKKVKLMRELNVILALNELALKRSGNETLANLSPERVAKIKIGYGKDLRKKVKLFRSLPTEILQQLGDLELFCFGYFSEDKRRVALDYFHANLQKEESA